MNQQLGDTPPNGDFARYVDQLMRDAERQVRSPVPSARPPVPGRPAARAVAANPSVASSPAAAQSAVLRNAAPFWLVARRLFVLWLGLQIAGAVYPPLAGWITPLVLLAFGAWWGLRRLRQQGGLGSVFGTPQWRELMKQYDANNPPPPQRGKRK